MRQAAGRIGGALVTLLLSSFLIYAALALVPGNTVAALSGGRRLTEAQIAALSDQYGLDEPFLLGYLRWLGRAVRGDFGDSLQYRSDVVDLVGSRLPLTLTLLALTAVITLVLGSSAAVLGAVRGGAVDRVLLVLCSAASAVPPFVGAIVLLAVFAVGLGWFPAVGGGEGFADRLWHLTLPAVAIAVTGFGVLARVGRAALGEQLAQEHVDVARSRGLGGAHVFRRHVWRNALGPVATLVALMVGTLFVGTVVVESSFGVQGVGQLLEQSVQRRDFPVVQAIALCAVAVFVVANTAVDLLMPLIDPRLRTRVATA